jgi:hypothetical protein
MNENKSRRKSILPTLSLREQKWSGLLGRGALGHEPLN